MTRGLTAKGEVRPWSETHVRNESGRGDEGASMLPSTSRRSFLKLAGVGAVAAITPQVLTACSTQEKATDGGAPLGKSGPVGTAQPDYDRVGRCTCAPNCVGSCGINAFVKDDTIVKVEPADFPDENYNRICLCGISNALQRVYSPDRIKYPMKRVGERGSGEWERISWEEAIDLICEKMTYNIENYGPTANSWLGMTGNYGIVPQCFSGMMASTYDGTQWTNFGIMGDLGCNMGWIPTTGVQQDAADWEDMLGSKTIIMFGCNYAETNKQEMHFLFDAQEAGSRVIVVDPRYSRTAAKADVWIPIRPGTDAALMMGMMNCLIADNKIDADYIRSNTNGAFLVDAATRKLVKDGDDYLVWDEQENAVAKVSPLSDDLKPAYPSVQVQGEVPDACDVPDTAAITGTYEIEVGGEKLTASPAFQAIVDSVAAYTPEVASAICEVSVDDIVELARAYAEDTPAKIQISQGTNRYWNGHLPTRAAIQMAAITGNVGKQYAGVNWAGGGLMRVLFSVNPEGMAPREGHAATALPGTQWMDLVASQQPHPIKLIWFNNYGWGTQGPEGRKLVEEVLPQLDFIITTDNILNAGAEMSDLVLPATSYYEEPFEVVTAWSNFYVQAREQVIPPMYEAKSDYEIGQMVAERFGIKDDTSWKHEAKEWARKYVIEGNAAPEFRAIDFDELVEKQVVRADFPSPYIPFESQRFATPSGKLEIYTDSLVDFGEEVAAFYEPAESNRQELAAKFPLTFMNARTVYTTHSQHVNLPWIGELIPEPWIEISTADAQDRGIATGDVVRVFNDRGEYRVKALVTEELKPGCVNQRQGWWPKHFPENSHYRDLLHMKLNPAQDAIFETNFAPYDNLVEIEKA
ncbi:molybdopterin-dependent oxidoreductase [Adlercreutzia sp. ZJ138]|uniref:molybdopterin-containing oxidoreductase family protein n=1 Tax=Adlercreutzia sp. ZJ138 TaxID=2709405 RepID=UPI001F14C47D|nr:molybdopterin-dependent oxidoreductase [Adlercreutzia sp. ZJ138]